MPLIKSGSRAAVSTNISEMVHSGYPQKQAVAAALSNARRYGKAAGGQTSSPSMGERMAARNVAHEGFLHSTVPGRTDRLPISVSGGAYVLPADHVAALGQGNSNAGANIVNKMFKMGPYGSSPTALKGTGVRAPHLNLKPGKFAGGGPTWGLETGGPYDRSVGKEMIKGLSHVPVGSGQSPADRRLIQAKQALDISDAVPRGYAQGGHGKTTPIIAAGGEIVIPPHKIVERFGDLDHGHKALDKWVVDTRKAHVKTLRHLKPPRKD